jgi:hypothetical protein
MLASCNKALIKPAQETNTARNNFEFLWKYIRDHYPYFDLKKAKYGLDWQKEYDKYSPRVKDGMSDPQLFDVMGSMMNDLHDGHSNLESPFEIQFYDKQYLDTANYNWGIIVRNYLMKTTGNVPTYFTDGVFVWGLLRDSVGYIKYGSFLNSVDNLDNLLRSFDAYKAKGIILDIRNNGGGAVEYAVNMAGRFVGSKTSVGYNRVQLSPGNWSGPLDQYIEPKGYHYTKPVVLLTDKGTFSAANLMAAYTKNLPNVTTLGDSSGGGGALPFDNELPNGWHFRISQVPFFMPDGFSVEEGIAPEVRVTQKPGSTISGRDDLIERALDLLK